MIPRSEMSCADHFGGTWYVWQDQARSGAENMAVDEKLASVAMTTDRALLRFYEWERKTISIGYFQSCRPEKFPGYAFVRRPTGGGVVRHGHDVTYSVIIPPNHLLFRSNRVALYKETGDMLVAALQTLGFDASLATGDVEKSENKTWSMCFQTPTKFDVMVGDRKAAGAAQRRRPQGILHQGSIDMSVLPAVDRTQVRTAVVEAAATLFGGGPERFTPDTDFFDESYQQLMEKFNDARWTTRR